MPEYLAAGPEPIPIVELAEVDSTNAEAMRRAIAGACGPLWISAARQSAGRGRLGRQWASLDGNLMATLLVEPRTPASRFGELALVAGIAAHETIAALQPLPSLRLKWPNDILLGDAKLGGILVESTTYAGTSIAAIGFGINIAAAPAVPDRATTALAHRGTPPSRAALLDTLSARMAHWLGIWRAPAGFDAVRTTWLERAGPVGEETTVNTGPSTCSGTFAGLDHDGALLLRDRSGNLRRFAFGDVTLTAISTATARGSHGG